MMLAMALGTNVSGFLLHTSYYTNQFFSAEKCTSVSEGVQESKGQFYMEDIVLALLHYINLLSLKKDIVEINY